MNFWLVDSHVHLHPCFEIEKFFDHCFSNLLKNSTNPSVSGILFLTQTKNENSFEELKKISTIFDSTKKSAKYFISTLNDNLSLKVESIENGLKLFIISSFQIVTKEKLEVLSIGTLNRKSDGLPIEEIIKNVLDDNAIPIIPWGFGKWYGKRGKIINKIMEQNIPNLFWGDNGGRSNLLPYPSQFRNPNIKILPGSDPLPFIEEIKKPFSYGFKFHSEINDNMFWKDVYKLILNPDFKVEKFGNLTRSYTFLKTQIKVQLQKR
jgi:hypothetical protein